MSTCHDTRVIGISILFNKKNNADMPKKGPQAIHVTDRQKSCPEASWEPDPPSHQPRSRGPILLDSYAAASAAPKALRSSSGLGENNLFRHNEYEI